VHPSIASSSPLNEENKAVYSTYLGLSPYEGPLLIFLRENKGHRWKAVALPCLTCHVCTVVPRSYPILHSLPPLKSGRSDEPDWISRAGRLQAHSRHVYKLSPNNCPVALFPMKIWYCCIIKATLSSEIISLIKGYNVYVNTDPSGALPNRVGPVQWTSSKLSRLLNVSG
jgi:hypothetical protein